jgi:hypothetical protein
MKVIAAVHDPAPFQNQRTFPWSGLMFTGSKVSEERPAVQTVVISTIGPTTRSPETTIYSEGVMNIATTMLNSGLRRFIAVDGLGANPNPDLPWNYALAMKMIARPFLDLRIGMPLGWNNVWPNSISIGP